MEESLVTGMNSQNEAEFGPELSGSQAWLQT
jgi:hypothetical protein